MASMRFGIFDVPVAVQPGGGRDGSIGLFENLRYLAGRSVDLPSVKVFDRTGQSYSPLTAPSKDLKKIISVVQQRDTYTLGDRLKMFFGFGIGARAEKYLGAYFGAETKGYLHQLNDGRFNCLLAAMVNETNAHLLADLVKDMATNPNFESADHPYAIFTAALSQADNTLLRIHCARGQKGTAKALKLLGNLLQFPPPRAEDVAAQRARYPAFVASLEARARQAHPPVAPPIRLPQPVVPDQGRQPIVPAPLAHDARLYPQPRHEPPIRLPQPVVNQGRPPIPAAMAVPPLTAEEIHGRVGELNTLLQVPVSESEAENVAKASRILQLVTAELMRTMEHDVQVSCLKALTWIIQNAPENPRLLPRPIPPLSREQEAQQFQVWDQRQRAWKTSAAQQLLMGYKNHVDDECYALRLAALIGLTTKIKEGPRRRVTEECFHLLRIARGMVLQQKSRIFICLAQQPSYLASRDSDIKKMVIESLVEVVKSAPEEQKRAAAVAINSMAREDGPFVRQIGDAKDLLLMETLIKGLADVVKSAPEEQKRAAVDIINGMNREDSLVRQMIGLGRLHHASPYVDSALRSALAAVAAPPEGRG